MTTKELKLKPRCEWPATDPLMLTYHDEEWGVPVHDDRKLFEFLVLESAQAGLSWLTVLRKREGYHKAFADFDPEKIARFDAKKIATLLQNPAIIRNRLKIEATINNSRQFLKVQEEFGSFAKYIWRLVDGKPIRNKWRKLSQLPAITKEAEALSKDLKSRGFKFLGPTVIYAHMQATGMVNDQSSIVSAIKKSDSFDSEE